jgi:hypothetical protein
VPIERAHAEFKRAMRDPLNLATIHGERRPRAGHYVSINRAIVVFTVAAWQAFVEALALQILDEISIPPGQPGHAQHRHTQAEVKKACHYFSTPNAEGVRELLLHVGFDPWPHWTWVWSRSRVTPARARDMMNAWLRVRHHIAHGDAELSKQEALNPTRSEEFALTLPNAYRCMKFFSRLADETTEAAIAEFESPERARAWHGENPHWVDPKAERKRLPKQRLTCPICQKKFLPRWGTQLYCSDSCSQTARHERQRRRHRQLPLVPEQKTCPICQSVFVPHMRTQVYCSAACRRERERRRRG